MGMNIRPNPYFLKIQNSNKNSQEVKGSQQPKTENVEYSFNMDALNDQKAEQIEQELRQTFQENVANLGLTNEQKMQLQQEIDSAIFRFKAENRGKYQSATDYKTALGKLIGDTTQKFLDSIQNNNSSNDNNNAVHINQNTSDANTITYELYQNGYFNPTLM